MTLFFELSIITLWFFLFTKEDQEKNKLNQIILMYGLLSTFMMEVINEVYFGELRMTYPHSFTLDHSSFPFP